DVVDLVRDVVHSGPTPRKEASDGRVAVESPEKLEPALADADRSRLDTLLLDARALLESGAEEALVRLDGTVEVLDGESYMMDAEGRLHQAIVCERLEPSCASRLSPSPC